MISKIKKIAVWILIFFLSASGLSYQPETAFAQAYQKTVTQEALITNTGYEGFLFELKVKEDTAAVVTAETMDGKKASLQIIHHFSDYEGKSGSAKKIAATLNMKKGKESCRVRIDDKKPRRIKITVTAPKAVLKINSSYKKSISCKKSIPADKWLQFDFEVNGAAETVLIIETVNKKAAPMVVSDAFNKIILKKTAGKAKIKLGLADLSGGFFVYSGGNQPLEVKITITADIPVLRKDRVFILKKDEVMV